MGQRRITPAVIAGTVAMLLAGAASGADAEMRGTAQFSANWGGGRLVAGSTGFQVENREGLTAVVGIAGAASRSGVTDARDGSVTFPAVTPGVGVRYYIRNGRPEYDFLVEPNARPEDIRLQVRTHGALTLNRSGDLVISNTRSVVALSRPRAYQTIDGRRRTVAASYSLHGYEAGFSVGPYDRAYELVIDPEVLAWSYPRLGSDAGVTAQAANAMATDTQGNVYITGETGSSKGYIIEIPAGGGSDTAHLILDSGGYTTPTAIAVDSSGYIYVTGYTNGGGLPVTSGPACCSAFASGFVLKFAPTALNGSTNPAAFYGTYFGASLSQGLTKPLGIAVNNSGIIWVTGETTAYDLPHPNSSTSYGGNPAGTFDGFAAEFDSVGKTELYGRFLGATQNTFGTGIAFDSNGIYIAGGTQAPNLPVTSGAWQSASPPGNTDGFLLRLNPSGPDTATYGTYIQSAQVNGLARSNGQIYLTGQVGSGLLFKSTSSGNQTASGEDAFVIQFNMTASPSVVYAKLFGGSGNDFGTAITADSGGNAYVIGTTNSTGTIGASGSLPAGSGASPVQSAYGGGPYDAFFAKFSSSGSVLQSTYLGGSAQDVSGAGPVAAVPTGGIALTSSGQVFLGGATYSGNFPGGSNESGNGAFVVALDVQVPNVALSFVPITPCRAVDTRNPAGPLGGPSITGGTTRSFAIAGNACGIPAYAAALSLNAAIIPTSHGYMTLWPAGQPQPGTASVNSPDGGVHSNGAIVPLGAGGALSAFAYDTMDVVLDVSGYFLTTSGNPSALAYYPVTPCRVADTRNTNGPLGGPFLSAGSTRSFPVLSAGSCNISSAAKAYALNIAVVPHGTFHYLTAWAGGQSQPGVATLNDPQSINHSNAAIVPAAADGSIDVYVTNDTDVVLDIDGYFAPQGTGGLSLYTLQPCRALDTRNPPGSSPFTGTIGVNVEGSNCAPSSSAQAYVFNATVVPQAGSHGFLTLWQQNAAQPAAVNLNAPTGATTGNLSLVPTNNGSINAFFSPGSTYLILDLFGYFAP